MRGHSLILVFAVLGVTIFSSVQGMAGDAGVVNPVLRKKPTPELVEHSPGCSWIGRQALLSIVREDIVAASELIALFERFECAKPHLRLAFDCVVKRSLPEKADQVTARIKACWLDPMSPPLETDEGKTTPAPSAAKPK